MTEVKAVRSAFTARLQLRVVVEMECVDDNNAKLDRGYRVSLAHRCPLTNYAIQVIRRPAMIENQLQLRLILSRCQIDLM